MGKYFFKFVKKILTTGQPWELLIMVVVVEMWLENSTNPYSPQLELTSGGEWRLIFSCFQFMFWPYPKLFFYLVKILPYDIFLASCANDGKFWHDLESSIRQSSLNQQHFSVFWGQVQAWTYLNQAMWSPPLLAS